MPRLLSVRMMRQAMAPRLAMSTLSNIGSWCGPSREWVSLSRPSCWPQDQEGSDRIPHQQLDGRRVVGVAGVVELRAVGDQHPHVHLGAQLHVLARTGDAIDGR